MTLFAAALAGFAVLAVEILGVHLLAPWFGSSTIVWSQQIGLVLLAIALGGWIGGRRASTSQNPRHDAAMCFAGGGLLLAFCLFGLAPFAAWILPQGLSLDQAASIFGRGSITAALLFFVPPVFFLSMISPLLVQIRAQERGPGRAAGEISCAGTIGSLAGVLFATFLALPILGVRPTLGMVAAILLLSSFLLRKKPAALAAAVVPLLLLLTPDASAQANLPEGAKVLAVAESSYQHLRVIEFDDGVRWLQMNEGVDSYQSLWLPQGGWPGGYYDLFALAPLYAHGDTESADSGTTPMQVWVLGFGTGTAVEPLAQGARAVGKRLAVTGVELDPVVSELGHEWMPLQEDPDVSLAEFVGADARAMLRAGPKNLDVIVLDAYARQFEIPLHLATTEFFAEVHSHLRSGGVFSLNLGTAAPASADSGLLGAVRGAVAESFGEHVRIQQVPYSRNWVLFARKDQALPELADLLHLLPDAWPMALGAACLPGLVRNGAPEGAVVSLSDDRNPLGVQQLLDWREGGE